MVKTNIHSKLKPHEKEAVGLLSIGTFLEYFDLMLYIHMASILNDVFFPKTGGMSDKLLEAFGYMSTFIARPFGAILLGWVGDRLGRKSTIIITTFMMAACCFTIMILPGYNQIGVTAAVAISVCRMLQGISSMGEIVGAELYLTETIPHPYKLSMTNVLDIFCGLGGMIALGVAHFVLSHDLNWRFVFAFGLIIAVVGGLARRKLRESPEFADARKRLKNNLSQVKVDPAALEQNVVYNEKVSVKTWFNFMYLMGLNSAMFYVVFVYCSTILENNFGFTKGEVIKQNFFVGLAEVIAMIGYSYLIYFIHPFQIAKYRTYIVSLGLILSPLIFVSFTSPIQVFIFQIFLRCLTAGSISVIPVVYKCIPVFKRYSSGATSFAFAKVIVWSVTTFGLVFLNDYFGNYAVLILSAPFVLAYMSSIFYFDKLLKISKPPIETVDIEYLKYDFYNNVKRA